ncbi:MAG: hypothetical protein AB8G99_16275 [Planctomycetaceae bacterium]
MESDENSNPYQNTTYDDHFKPPPPTEYVSTLAVAAVVASCLMIFVLLAIALASFVSAQTTSPLWILLTLAAIVVVPIALGWMMISWLRHR